MIKDEKLNDFFNLYKDQKSKNNEQSLENMLEATQLDAGGKQNDEKVREL